MLFLDIETKNIWDVDNPPKMSEMEISFVGAIDSDTGKEYEIWEADLPQLGEIMKASDLIVHYNGFTFDMPVLANYLGSEVLNYPQLDLMVAAHRAFGFRPKLDDLANANLGYGKSGSGADAVKYWVSGDLESLKKYCMDDVRITMEIYNYGKNNGHLKYYSRSGFVNESKIDWNMGMKMPRVENNDNIISMF